MLPPPPSDPFNVLMQALTARRRVFVSYHHLADRTFYEAFSSVAYDTYDAVEDGSVDRILDSDDAEYVIRTIREKYITGTSCTFVLCGVDTWRRKFVDWEIKATLDKEHALIGVRLPTNPTATAPDRFLDNWRSGYAIWIDWSEFARGVVHIRRIVEDAQRRPKHAIDNSRPLRTKNS